MTLSATKVTINGRRVWLQNAEPSDVEYMNYHAQNGFGQNIRFDPALPDMERIEDNAVREGASPVQSQ
jgi:hypothetical protein